MSKSHGLQSGFISTTGSKSQGLQGGWIAVDAGGGLQNRRDRSVVLLQPDQRRAREVLLEVENVAHRGGAETVDALRVVAHGHDVGALAAEAPQE